MKKVCVICQVKEAILCIKGTNECYCYDCAIESFGDINLLVKIEDGAKRLHDFIEKKLSEEELDKKPSKKKDLDVLIDVKIKKEKKKTDE
jgi:hypothetical protein